MKFLIDTNILIPLEPTSVEDVEPKTAAAAKLAQSIQQVSSQIYVHPAQRFDFANDRDIQRRSLREMLTGKYPELVHPPPVNSAMEALIGTPSHGTNEWVDNSLLAAVVRNAVDYLVTEDLGIHRKANRLRVSDRVLTLHEAINALTNLFRRPSTPPPAVREIPAYGLNENDPIWDSFRADYPEFDNWFKNIRLDHRPTWVIDTENGYAGIAILKPEDSDVLLPGKTAKICSFKIDPTMSGFRFGELLLKAILNYVALNGHDWIYLTAFDKQAHLIGFLSEFGFVPEPVRNSRGEHVLVKQLNPEKSPYDVSGLEYSIRFGPNKIDLNQPIYVVPIQPRFHGLLFPDITHQLSLEEGDHAFGNGIRKAYICHSPVKALPSGAVLAFYCSKDLHAVTGLGVVEKTIRSSLAEEVAAAVAKRTVYTFDQIQDLCAKEVLAILFRQSLRFRNPVRLKELVDGSMLKAAPISIVKLPEFAGSWMENRLQI